MKKLISLTVAVAMTLSMAHVDPKLRRPLQRQQPQLQRPQPRRQQKRRPPLKQVKLQVMPTP